MAFIDDNNSGIPAGAGKDPLAELDRELEQLRITLGELEPAEKEEEPEPAAKNTIDKEEIPKESPAEGQEAAQPAAPRESAVRAPEAEADKPPVNEPKKPRTALIIAALIFAITGIAAGAFIYALNRPLGSDQPEEPTTVTVHDSELGTVPITPPEDASVNNYETENLVLEDNGYYSYYVNGKKVSEMGVDLSEYQGEIDFSAVRESGVDFVILRIGGRFYGDKGTMYKDEAFLDYYQQAKTAGLKVGAYFFSQAASTEDAVEEAQYTLDLLGGLALDYPIAFDWEIIDDDVARTDNVSGEELTRIAAAFCDTVEAAGYRSIVYASTSLILQSYDFETMKNYDFWLADYRELPDKEQMYYHFTMWQYSTGGTVPGIEGTVDMNLYLNAEEQ